MDLSQLSSERAGRPILAQAGYASFSPNPLPPAVQLTGDLVARLSEADRAVGRLGGVGLLLKNPYLLVTPFLAKEAVLSSRIEGTQASLSDLFFFEAAPGTEPTPNDAREVANYSKALDYALSPTRALPVSLRLLREMHRILMDGVRGDHLTPGEFRRSQNWIGRPGCTLADATFVPPTVDDMKRALDDFEKYLHAADPLPPLIRLAVIHYQFEAIHPFLDGNGRIGRLLVALLLSEWKILESPLLYLSAFFERNRQAYYDGLLGVSLRGEWERWIDFFLRGVASQALDAAERAKKLALLHEDFIDRVKSVRGSMALIPIIDEIMQHAALTISRAREVTSLTHQGASWNISRLVKLGILRKTTSIRRPHLYYSREVIDLLNDDLVSDSTGLVHT